jgi:bacterioferritin-associated ferredoxin
VYICLCKGIREAEFEDIIVQTAGCAKRVQQAMGLDESCCGRCEENLDQIIQNSGVAGCTRS